MLSSPARKSTGANPRLLSPTRRYGGVAAVDVPFQTNTGASGVLEDATEDGTRLFSCDRNSASDSRSSKLARDGGDVLKLLVCSFNVGNSPLGDISTWIPPGGGDFDLIVVGLQESTYRIRRRKGSTGADSTANINIGLAEDEALESGAASPADSPTAGLSPAAGFSPATAAATTAAAEPLPPPLALEDLRNRSEGVSETESPGALSPDIMEDDNVSGIWETDDGSTSPVAPSAIGPGGTASALNGSHYSPAMDRAPEFLPAFGGTASAGAGSGSGHQLRPASGAQEAFAAAPKGMAPRVPNRSHSGGSGGNGGTANGFNATNGTFSSFDAIAAASAFEDDVDEENSDAGAGIIHPSSSSAARFSTEELAAAFDGSMHPEAPPGDGKPASSAGSEELRPAAASAAAPGIAAERRQRPVSAPVGSLPLPWISWPGPATTAGSAAAAAAAANGSKPPLSLFRSLRPGWAAAGAGAAAGAASTPLPGTAAAAAGLVSGPPEAAEPAVARVTRLRNVGKVARQRVKELSSGATHLRQALRSQLGPDFEQILSCRRMQMRMKIYLRKGLLHEYVPEESEVAGENTGIGKVVANKGGLACKLKLRGTTFCFVSCHLQAHAGAAHLDRRNKSCAEILQGVRMGPRRRLDLDAQFHHTVWFGDLNYRIDFGLPFEEQQCHVLRLIEHGDWAALFRGDELNRELLAQRLLFGFTAAVPAFAPTFKTIRGATGSYDDRRIPSWTDRILYKSLPGAVANLEMLEFVSCPEVSTSDHLPVKAAFNVMLVGERRERTAEAVDPTGGASISGKKRGGGMGVWSFGLAGPDPKVVFDGISAVVAGAEEERPYSRAQSPLGSSAASASGFSGTSGQHAQQQEAPLPENANGHGGRRGGGGGVLAEDREGGSSCGCEAALLPLCRRWGDRAGDRWISFEADPPDLLLPTSTGHLPRTDGQPRVAAPAAQHWKRLTLKLGLRDTRRLRDCHVSLLVWERDAVLGRDVLLGVASISLSEIIDASLRRPSDAEEPQLQLPPTLTVGSGQRRHSFGAEAIATGSSFGGGNTGGTNSSTTHHRRTSLGGTPAAAAPANGPVPSSSPPPRRRRHSLSLGGTGHGAGGGEGGGSLRRMMSGSIYGPRAARPAPSPAPRRRVRGVEFDIPLVRHGLSQGRVRGKASFIMPARPSLLPRPGKRATVVNWASYGGGGGGSVATNGTTTGEGFDMGSVRPSRDGNNTRSNGGCALM